MKTGKYLFIHASIPCNASCSFCMHRQDGGEWLNGLCLPNFLDPYTLWDSLEKAIEIVKPNHIEITALGEPGLNNKLDLIAHAVNSLTKNMDIEKHIYTNGTAITQVEDSVQFKGWDLDISVHSTNKNERIEIFGKDFLPYTINFKNINFHFVKTSLPDRRFHMGLSGVYAEFSRYYKATCYVRTVRDAEESFKKEMMSVFGPYYEHSKGCDTYPVIATDGNLYSDWTFSENVIKTKCNNLMP
jgi:hypothetical protein